eukprot:jgi/Mesvir1/7580/Mv02335-RA.1
MTCDGSCIRRSVCASCRPRFRHVSRVRERGVPDFALACDRVGVSPLDGADLMLKYLCRTCSTPVDLVTYVTRALIATASFEDGFEEILRALVVSAAMTGVMALARHLHKKHDEESAAKENGVFLQVAVSAALLHVLFEAMGWNRKFCVRMGATGRLSP